jgi:predicted peroxiredoxin
MRGLTILVVGADAARFHSALSIAAAQAAIGGVARIFLDAGAVALLTPPIAAPDDTRHAAAGLPILAVMLDEALDLGVAITACQTGLALTGIDARSLDARIETGGLVGIMTSLGEDRLIAL